MTYSLWMNGNMASQPQTPDAVGAVGAATYKWKILNTIMLIERV